jgi:hypothetical protein
MPTFRRVEIVDARQFTGGLEQGMDLCLWVNSNYGRAQWMERREVGSKVLSERIRLYDENQVTYAIAWLGDWIVRHQDGSWEVVRTERMQAEYEEV